MRNSFYLISKREGQKFVKYKGDAVRLSSGFPYTFDEVVIGVKGKIGQEKKITTFRDSKNNIIERVFDYYGKPIKNQVFTYTDNVIGDSEFVTSKTMKEFSISKPMLKAFKEFKELYQDANPMDFWQKNKIETDHISENINTGEKVVSRVISQITKVITRDRHSFIEFPHIVDNKVEKKPAKSLSFLVNIRNNNVIPDSQVENGIKMPKKDSFLGFRALGIEDAKIPLVERFLKERKLEKLGIEIYPEYLSLADNEKLIAFYSEVDGSINFNKNYKIKSKAKLVHTARHEVEHAWQYFLRDRLTGGKTLRSMEVAKRFGGLRSKKQQREANRYKKSIENYVPFHVDFEKYKKNLIEIHANKAGDKAKNQYTFQGKSIRESLPHIPTELM